MAFRIPYSTGEGLASGNPTPIAIVGVGRRTVPLSSIQFIVYYGVVLQAGSTLTPVASLRLAANSTLAADSLVSASMQWLLSLGMTADSSMTAEITVNRGVGSNMTASSAMAASLDTTWKADLSLLANDSLLTPARTGNATYVARSSVTALSIAAGSALYEDQGDGLGGGVWSFPGYTNRCTQPFDFSTWTGVAGVASGVANGAPDGTTASKVYDSTPSSTPFRYSPGIPGSNPSTQSVWVRDDVITPPTVTGGMACDQTNATGVNFPAGAAWKRVKARGAGTVIQTIYPAGQSIPSPTTIGATGAVEVWGSSQLDGYLDLPLTTGASGAATLALASAQLAQLINNGAIHVGGKFLPSWNDAANAQDFYYFSATLSDGLFAFRYSHAARQLMLTVRGVDVLTINRHTPNTLQPTYEGFLSGWECWYNPSTGQGGIRTMVGGMWSSSATVTAAGAPLTGATAAYLGSNLGTSGYLPARHTEFTVYPSSSPLVPMVEGIALGSSDMQGAWDYVSEISRLYTPLEAKTRVGLGLVAAGGDTTATQKAAYLASPWRGAQWAIAMLGENDIGTGMSTSAIIAGVQDMVNTLSANGTEVLLCTMAPAHSHWIYLFGPVDGEVAQQKWLDVNDAIMGLGGTPITGVAGRCNTHTVALADASWNLLSIYARPGDLIHWNNVGRALVAGLWRTELTALGWLP
jgi:hypothetical protein